MNKWENGAIVIDFETRSKLDLRKSNAYVYSCHDSTTALCCAYKIIEPLGNDLYIHDTMLWIEDDFDCPKLLQRAIENGYIVWAHNVFFERCIWENVMVPKFDWLEINPDKYRCSAAQAAAMGLPRSLFEVGKALGLHTQKDDKGHRVMMQLCKPRKPTKNNPDRWFTKKRYPEKYEQLYRYCINDVDAEFEVIDFLPNLSKKEFKVWQLDQKINMRGIYCDRESVLAVLKMIGDMQYKANLELEKITKGKVTTPNQRDRILAWCKRKGTKLKKLDAQSVESALEGRLKKKVRRVLEIRQLMSKASVKKYQAMIDQISEDNRIRALLLYHAAHTGRWGGKDVQPQNLPRGTIKSMDEIEWCIRRIRDYNLRALEMVYDNPTDVFSSCARAMLLAAPECSLIASDFSSIESCVLFWFAKDRHVLGLLRDGKSLYKDLAGDIFGLDPEKIEKSSDEYYIGKKGILALGYGMGVDKFFATLQSEGKDVSKDLCKLAVKTYREKRELVPKLWKRVEKAAIQCVMDRVRTRVGPISFECKSRWLVCNLPSGRRFCYYKPQLKEDVTPWDTVQYKLSYMGVKNYKWQRITTYGGKLVENIVQAIARDLMAEAMIKVDEEGYDIVLTVHDEIVVEVPDSISTDAGFRGIMSSVPKWAKGIPISCESWIGERYRK